MIFEITIPSPGESITQVQLAKWLCNDGDAVEKDQEIVEIDSDKASFPLSAPENGIIHFKVAEGDTIAVGAVIATVDSSAEFPQEKSEDKSVEKKNEKSPVQEAEKPVVSKEKTIQQKKISPQAEKIIEEKHVNVEELSGKIGTKRIRSKDVEQFLSLRQESSSRNIERKKLSTLRLKLAERLVAVKNQTAMLTTFNEVNLAAVMNIRNKYNEAFKEKHGISLGFMSFFTKAVSLALNDFPQVNAMIDGEELLVPDYHDIGIAVSTPKGLVVPVIRDVQRMSIAEIEAKIRELAEKARKMTISIDEMQGGTFTITNGGVFGSLMSTPILNPPQSAILGMHKIMDRPVAVEGKVEIHPMMYLAVSYDHRVIDGKESVGFLVKIKEYIEEPITMITSGKDPFTYLLEL
ncbi:MAG: 2-oxoglutarate dehydrogenase complex dihydrolipoyllysine-residue succinyltransferase [Syntrophothermus sp.]